MGRDRHIQQLTMHSTDFEHLYRDLQEDIDVEQPLRIVVCGLMNAGKSALLNALTDHLDPELFETRAVRCTMDLQSVEHEGFVYADTPGIDFSEKDDQLAWLGLATADIILFAHNMQIGALEAVEIDFLKALRKRRPDTELCLMVVLTHADSASEQLDRRVKAIDSMLDTIFEAPRALAVTSFTRYRKGTLQAKPALVQHSGIGMLREQIHGLVLREQMETGRHRAARRSDRRYRLALLVDEAIAERERELAAALSRRAHAVDLLVRSLTHLRSTLAGRVTHCAGVKPYN